MLHVACSPAIVATTAEKSRSAAPCSAASSNQARFARACLGSRPVAAAVSVTSLRSFAACRSLKLGANRPDSTLQRRSILGWWRHTGGWELGPGPLLDVLGKQQGALLVA